MSSKDFNEELGEYLTERHKIQSYGGKSRKGLGLFDRIFGQKENEVVEIIDEGVTATEAEELDELEDEVRMLDDAPVNEERKEGLMKKFLKSMRKDRSPYAEEDFEEAEELPVIDEDVKKILKITYTWLNQLPPMKMREFSQSDDFRLYKDILQKYGLIRSKQESQPVEYGDAEPAHSVQDGPESFSR